MNLASLVWSDSLLRVITSDAEFVVPQEFRKENLYWIKLFRDHEDRLYLRASQNRQPFWVSSDKATFTPVDPIPGRGEPLPEYNCKVHPDSGLITALERHTLWTGNTTGHWSARQLPPDLKVRDVSFDGNGGLWCAGAVASDRIPGEETEAAVRYQTEEGAPFEAQSPRLNIRDAGKVIAHGGLAELRSIDAGGHPVVATSICSSLLEDESSFVFFLGGQKTRVQKLKNELICHIDRPQTDTLRIFGCRGGLWKGSAPKLKRITIKESLMEMLGLSGREILVRGMDTSEESIALAVEIGQPDVLDVAQDPEFSAVCISMDGGVSFEMQQRFEFTDGVEALDVAFIDTATSS